MHVSVFGLGYVGTVTAACLARDGHDVVGVDVDPDKVRAINEGRAPVAEPGLADTVAEDVAEHRLRATTSVTEAIDASDLALICVGTPSGAHGRPELTALWRVGCAIGRALRERKFAYTVVLRSTVLPGTTERVLARALEWGAGGQGPQVFVAMNPEFMREGTALRDFAAPPFTLLGCADPRSASLLRRLYEHVDAPVIETDLRVAETVKYACNAFHALKICFANEMGALCAALGVDGQEVMRVFRLDHKLNVSEAYLRPGFAFGGSCLPKDVRALGAAGRAAGLETPVLGAILPSNQKQLHRAVERILATGKRRIGVVGLTFKPGTDDVRESPMVLLAEALLCAGCDVRVFDPQLSLPSLLGANRQYLDQHLADLPARLCQSATEVALHAEVLVLGRFDADAAQAALQARPECEVIDLTRGAPPAVRPTAVEEEVERPAPHAALLGALLALLFLAAPSAAAARTLHVARGGDLQEALDRARPGDTVTLEAGATFEGPFVLPRKDGAGAILIRSTGDVGPPGRRVGPAQAAAMATLASDRDPVLAAAPGAHDYTLIGLALRPDAGVFLHNLVVLGDAAIATADLPRRITIDRCLLSGDPVAGTRRGVALNSAATEIVHSYFADFKERGADSQAIAGWSGPGPFLIADNYLEAAGENLLFGGADPPDPARIPSDIVVRGNHLAKPLAWRKAGGWSVKNLFELKDARRVLVEGNLLENNWPDAQNGFAVLFTVRNQDGGAPFSTVEDVVFRANVVRRSANGVNILGRDDARAGASGPTRRVEIRDNLFADIGGAVGAGTLFQLTAGAADVRIEHNTALHSGNVITADGAASPGFVFRDNLVRHNAYGIFGSGAGVGAAALRVYFPGAEVRRNVIAGGHAEDYPPDNFFPPALDGVLVVERGAARLAPGSAYATAASDGHAVGADPDAIAAALRAE
jgi:GDP-mannose 6-dehydrogenase